MPESITANKSLSVIGPRLPSGSCSNAVSEAYVRHRRNERIFAGGVSRRSTFAGAVLLVAAGRLPLPPLSISTNAKRTPPITATITSRRMSLINYFRARFGTRSSSTIFSAPSVRCLDIGG